MRWRSRWRDSLRGPPACADNNAIFFFSRRRVAGSDLGAPIDATLPAALVTGDRLWISPSNALGGG